MSGGSFGYMYNEFKEMYAGEMKDKDLDELVADLSQVLHDLEWWQSSDIGEESYRKTVDEFKKKWLSGYDDETNGRIERFKNNLLQTIEKQLREV